MKIKTLFDTGVIKTFEEINKGWSSDKKIYVQTNNHQEFLIRVSSIDTFEEKKIEYDKMQELYALGIPMSQPLDIGIHKETVQTLFTWIVGEDAQEVLPALNESKQYELGYQAGSILKKIHQIPAPHNLEPWESSFDRKIERNIQNYQNCDIKYTKGELFLNYIEENRHLIQNRPLTFQHGDFHTGNMILSSTNELSIIDFNRWSYGDPWEEFNRIDFSAQVSSAFATGQIDGYFSGNPPMEFFKLMALYISVNALNALPWAKNYSQNEVQTTQKKAISILEWYDGLKIIVPKWYHK